MLSLEIFNAIDETWRTLRFTELFAKTIVSGSILEASAELDIKPNDMNVLQLPYSNSVSAVSTCTSPCYSRLLIHAVLKALCRLGREHLPVDAETTICIA
jgi:hypothetical protein